MNQEKTRISIKEILLKGLTELMVLILAILFFFIVYKFQNILRFVKLICGILMPIILGVVLAYLINPLVVFFEKRLDKLFKEKLKTKRRISGRMPAILISILILAVIIYVVAYLVIPQIYLNVRNLIYNLPRQVNDLYLQISKWMEDDERISDMINSCYSEAMTFLTNWVKTDMVDQFTTLLSGVVGFVGAIVDFLVGLIVAVYVLMSKETFLRQFKMLLHAFFDDKKVGRITAVLKESDRIFGGFITGKLLDSLIIGILCFIGAVILKLPYAVLVSVVVGVTNVIPFFGPYIGAIPSSILILLSSPSKGLIFIIFIILLQQFDGNILGPKILGESTGLSPFWVIFAILLGGGLFGIVGMLVGVPTFGVIYYLMKSFIHYRLRIKGKEEIGFEKGE